MMLASTCTCIKEDNLQRSILVKHKQGHYIEHGGKLKRLGSHGQRAHIRQLTAAQKVDAAAMQAPRTMCLPLLLLPTQS